MDAARHCWDEVNRASSYRARFLPQRRAAEALIALKLTGKAKAEEFPTGVGNFMSGQGAPAQSESSGHHRTR